MQLRLSRMHSSNVAALRRLTVAALVFCLAASLHSQEAPPRSSPSSRTPASIEYRGWKQALRLKNDHAEVVVVPDVGRVLSFRFHDGANVLWEDTSLSGKSGDPTGKEWVNFGGDKTWPAPEDEWKNYTRYTQWMPPPGFDGMPHTARIERNAIVLTSPVDPFYGVRTIRRITLERDQPVMTITTTYERVSGEPSKIAIWVITQFVDPVGVYLPVAENSKFPNGFFKFRDRAWPQLKTFGNLLKLTRDPQANHKLGSDANRMLWVGETAMCLVETPRMANAEYPDRGASAEVYTNSDPKKYVELETLGPLALLKRGDRIEQTNTYTLMRRTSGDPDADARRVLGVR